MVVARVKRVTLHRKRGGMAVAGTGLAGTGMPTFVWEAAATEEVAMVAKEEVVKENVERVEVATQ